MVSTGAPRNSATRTTEIIDLLANDDVTCQDIDDYPLEVQNPVASNLASFPVVICGGNHGATKNQCYKLMEGGWQEFATMNFRRYGAAGMVYGNLFHIFGGYDSGGHDSSGQWNIGSGELKSTEMINENGQVSQGPDLPTPLHEHAIATVNSSTSILSGGITDTNNESPLTWYYNHATQKFQVGPSLMGGRRHHSSGTLVDQETNENIVAVVGGSVDDSTELLLDGEWQQGKYHFRL